MDLLESIVKDLQSLPATRLVEVARFVHEMTETAQSERRALLKQTHGALSAADGEAFEQALASSRELDSFNKYMAGRASKLP
jgi:hypothetical protein